jgi:hypothetical protein
MAVSLVWTPQRLVWIALAVTAFTVLVCVVLVIVDRRRAPPAPAERAPRRWARIGTPWLAVGAGALFLVAAGVLPALVAAAVAVAAPLRGRRLRRWLWIVPAGFMGLTAAYVVAKSWRYSIPADLDWPAAFSFTTALAWSAVAATVTLVAATAAEVAWPRGERRTGLRGRPHGDQ